MPQAPRRAHLSGAGRALVGLAIGGGVAGLLLLARGLPVVEGIETRLVDARTRAFAGDRAPDPRIVVCQVEEGDVRAVRRDLHIAWPWPLDLNAVVFDTMRAAGARAVLVDVMHVDRGAAADDLPASEWNAGTDDAALLGEGDAGDALGKALRDWGAAALAVDLADPAQWELPGRAAAAEKRLGTAHVAAPPRALWHGGADLPARRVLEGAARVGFVNVPVDADNVARRAWTLAHWGDRTVASLALAGASLASGSDPEPAGDGAGVRVGAAIQRTMDDGSFLLAFRSTEGRPYPSLRPSQVLAWHEPLAAGKPLPPEARAALEGKIVVWGVNLSGAKDVVSCPVGEKYEGPQWQATALDDLLHGDGRVRAGTRTNAAVLFAAALLVGLVGCAPRRRWLGHVAALAALAGIVALGVVLFARGTSIDLATPSFAVVLVWGGGLVERTLTEGRYNRWLEGTFSRYLAKPVIERLKEDPSLLDLGGRRREITMLFSDVAGFTKLSERLDPQDVVSLLNRYLTGHCDAVLAEGGVIDKFMGDGVMAFFGDPIPQEDHATRACRASLAVQAGLLALEPHWRRLGLAAFPVRVGLNSGEAVVGNMGSEHRLDYTCMGDVVNLASRLEGANKAFGTRILLGPETRAQAGASVLAKALADVVVVGREAPIAVAELLAMRDGAPHDLVAHVEAFRLARAALLAGDLDAADGHLAVAERLRPGDGPCAWLRAIAAKMRAGREPSPWSGVVALESKG